MFMVGENIPFARRSKLLVDDKVNVDGWEDGLRDWLFDTTVN